MNNQAVNFDEKQVEDLRSTIISTNERLNTSITNISNELAKLQTAWPSQAGQSFMVFAEAIKDDFQTASDFLATYARFLEQTVSLYHECEKKQQGESAFSN